MAASSHGETTFLQLLENNYLECNLCFDTYKKPKYLNCHHTFCEGCLTEYLKHKPGDIVCPTCRVVTKVPKDGGIPALQNNFLINSLTDEASLFKDKQLKCENCSEDKMAAMVCVECATYMCDVCYKGHQMVKILRDTHNTFDVNMLKNMMKLQEFQRNLFTVCSVHNEPMKLFCRTERKQLCHTCSFSNAHDGHKVCPIQEQLDQLLAQITTHIEKNEIDDSLIASENKKLEALITEAEKSTIKSLSDINKEKAEVIQQVNEKYNTMSKEIQEANQKRVDICKSKMAENNVLKKSVKSKISERDALKVIPISSGIEAAEGLLESLSKLGETLTVQKRESEDEQKLKYFEANTKDKELVIKVGSIKNKYTKKPVTDIDRVVEEKGSVNPCKSVSKVTSVAEESKAPVRVESEPVDKSRAHYKDGRNVRVGDRVVRGPGWDRGGEDGGAGSLGTVTRFCSWNELYVYVRWDKQHSCKDNYYPVGTCIYRLKLAGK